VSLSHRRASKVGVVDLGLEGPAGLPEEELGFAVQWRAAPNGVRKAIRQRRITGVVVQFESTSVEPTASIVHAVEREDKRMPVWLAMSSPRVFVLSRVVSAIRIGKGSSNDLHVLTPRELEVLMSIRQGYTNQAIAAGLGVSLSTVKRHVEHILLKLAAKNRAQAAARLRHQVT
jgi:DNA-binding NarL/FixJ family response regulator